MDGKQLQEFLLAHGITPESIEHKGEPRIKLTFDFDPVLAEAVKQIPGRLWSRTLKAWHVPRERGLLEQLVTEILLRKGIAVTLPKPGISTHQVSDGIENKKEEILNLPGLDASFENNSDFEQEALSLSPENTSEIPGRLSDEAERYVFEHCIQFKDYLQSRRFSENTIRSYTAGLKIFLVKIWPKRVDEIEDEDVIQFFKNYTYKNKLSISWHLLLISAIKLFYKNIVQKKLNIDSIIRPHKDKILPNVLSKEEITRIISVTTNPKHKAMICLIYACGLRRGELLKLEPKHINSDRGVLLIKAAKGRKDRITPIPKAIIEMLRNYYKQYKPEKYLFEGQLAGETYSERSINLVFKKSCTLAKITKPATLHWLRHSYATHHLEKGTDLRYIQELLGHTSSRTTEIYTHVSAKKLTEMRSPFEDLDL